MKWNKFLAGILILALVLCGCSCIPEDKESDGLSSEESMTKTMEESALESFCDFYVRLLEEGREEELEQYVISRRLSDEEAAAVGEEHKEVSYFRGFREGEHNAKDVMVLEADFDSDGKMDILEYDFDNGKTHSACSLTIYRMEDGEFVMKYSQPKFDRMGYYVDMKVSAVRYDGETFLLIETARDDVMSIETDIYWLIDWELAGKCSVGGGASRETVTLEYVLPSEEGYRSLAEKICRDAPIITHGVENCIVSVSGVLTIEKSDIGGHFWGSAEEGLAELIINEEADMNQISFVERYDGNSGITRETISEVCDFDMVYRFWAWNSQMFQSDINNDGRMEMYVKEKRANELYYYMESGGRVVYFEDLCDLNIREQGLIPKMFWVEEVDERNITFLLYQSADRREFEIVGYDIQGREYTEVLKVGGHADVECQYEYEWKKEGESGGLPYGVRMAYDDIEHVVLYGMQDEKRQEIINQKTEEQIRQEIESGSLQAHYAEKEGFANYTLYRATKGEVVVDYEYIWFDDKADKYYSERCSFLIDISNGNCSRTGYWDFDENVW
ncbi:MAG: hypothetical protein HDQ96_05180 [Lachnospiraceae bacterium]|nr:hypothetical protein [Lachnospiraceae bacterium]